MNTPTAKPIEIFKPGRHTAMSGAVLDFSEADMRAMVDAYDPRLHEAPLVIGHPKVDGPRYGGVGSLSFADGIVAAAPKDVVPEFADWVGKKLFNQVSASLYTPGAPGNPVPGVYYLRHVGFLGAQPPAIKGLNPNGISFGDADEGVVEFNEWSDRQNASLWRRLREWFIADHGLEKADAVIPDYAVATIEDEARREPAGEAAPAPAFAEVQPTQGDEMSPEDKARLEALEAENTRLKAEAAARVRAAREAGNAEFAEGLVKEGRLAPGVKPVMLATLNALGDQAQVVEFGEGDTRAPLVDALKAALKDAPPVIDFAERSAAEMDAAAGGAVNFAAPDGYQVDAKSLDIHTRALAYQREHKVSYAEAVDAVAAS